MSAFLKRYSSSTECYPLTGNDLRYLFLQSALDESELLDSSLSVSPLVEYLAVHDPVNIPKHDQRG